MGFKGKKNLLNNVTYVTLQRLNSSVDNFPVFKHKVKKLPVNQTANMGIIITAASYHALDTYIEHKKKGFMNINIFRNASSFADISKQTSRHFSQDELVRYSTHSHNLGPLLLPQRFPSAKKLNFSAVKSLHTEPPCCTAHLSAAQAGVVQRFAFFSFFFTYKHR